MNIDKNKTIIYGASDDLIEIDGGLCEEIGSYDFDGYLACSDGTLLKMKYDGDWIIRAVRAGSLFDKITPSVGEEDNHAGEYSGVSSYSDIAVFKGKLTWVLQGKTLVK
jgi:hypothetical protein